MTVPAERRRAVEHTRKWLYEVICMKLRDIRKNPRAIRSAAIRLLRHYPESWRDSSDGE